MKSKARTFLGTADEHLKVPIDSVVVSVGIASARRLIRVRLLDEGKTSREMDERSERLWRMKRSEKSWMRGNLSVFPDPGR